MVNTLRPRWRVNLPHSIQREMDQVFDQFFGRSDGESASSPAAAAAGPTSLWEEQDRWCVEVDLPGVKQEDLDITLEKNALRVTAQRHAPQEERKYLYQERGFGQFERLISLPDTVDPERIEAELKDGVLRLNLAKRPELQPKKIQIKAS